LKFDIKQGCRRVLESLPATMVIWLETGYLLLRQRIRFAPKSPAPVESSKGHLEATDELIDKISDQGYVELPGYKSAEWCEAAREEFYRLSAVKARLTEHTEDSRIFGIESCAGRAAEFANDPFLLALAARYSRSDERLLFCMANRVSYREGVAYGSGGEWHRDGFRRELKAMLYLTDVDSRTGPFAVIRRSHRFTRILSDTSRLSGWLRRGEVGSISATRLKSAGQKFEAASAGRTKTFVGSAGTLIVFDTSAIHAGLPPQPGGNERLALTNYYCNAPDMARALEYYRAHVNLNVAAHAAELAAR
jgi:hypothetical protein